MSTTLTTTQLQQQYIAYFGRPGDPSGITFWLESGLTETEFAEKIYAQDEYKNTTIASKSTEEQVNSLFTNLFGRSAAAEGLLFWTNEVDSGRKSLSSLALDLIWSANNPIEANTTQGAADALALANKVAAAEAFTADVKADPDAILAYQPETTGADFKAGAAFDSAKTWLATITSTAATDAGVDTAVSNMTSASTTTTGTTTTLTDKVDTVSGGAYNDTFVGSNATLTTGDSITGGSGTDVLRYTATGAAAVIENGFTTSSVETLKVQSDATGGTTFTATGSTGVSTVVNTLSTTDVTIDGLKALATVELKDVQAGNTTIRFNDDLLSGSSDAITLNLDGNVTTAGGAIGTITVGNTGGAGVETLNVNSSGAASEVTNIAGGFTTVNVTGDKDLTITGALANVTTVAASGFTGDLSVVVDSDTAAKDVVVTGGSGDDTADFTDGFQDGDSFTGGDGTDAIRLTQAVASAAINGTLSSVENLEVSDAGTGIIDMDSFSGITRVVYDAGILANGTATVDDAVSGVTVEVDAANLIAADGSLVVDLKTDGASDEITVAIDTVAAGEGIATLNAADAETLNISVDDDTTDATGTFTIATLVATDATSIVLSGDSTITVTATTDPATPVLTSIDASAATDEITISGTNFAEGGATITLGSANDTLTFATAAGADTIDLSKGGDDTIVYTALAQSDTDRDIVKGFTSGSDDINLTGLVGRNIISSSQFAGVGASFAEAQGLLDGTKVAVFNAGTNTLWVDIDADSVLEGATDFQVKLEGVTSITSADLTLGTGVTATSNQAAFSTATATHFTEGGSLTNEDDTIVTTVTHLAGSTINGLGGDDTINVTAATAASNFNFSGIAFSDVETMTIGSNITGITMNVADLTALETNRIDGVSGTTQSLTITGGTVDFKPITLNNIETIVSPAEGVLYEFDTDNLTDVTSLDLDAGTLDTIELAGGTYDFSAITMANTAGGTLDLNTADNLAKTLTVDAADFTGFAGGVTGETTANIITTINFNDTDDISTYTTSNIDTITIGGTNQTLTLDEDDLGTATHFSTITGSGDSNLVISDVAGTDGALTLVNTTISGFDTITTDQGNTAMTLDAASLGSTAVTLVGDAATDITLTEDVDLSQVTLNTADFNTLTLAAGVDLTTDSSFWGSAVAAVEGTTTGTITINIDAAGATLDLGGITTGAASIVASTSIVGTTGNDVIETYATKGANEAFTIATGTGVDTVRIGGEDSGNIHTDNAGLYTATLANAVRVTDFDATSDTIAVPVGVVVNSNNAVGSVASGAHNSSTGAAFALLTGATLSDFTAENSFYGAVGAVNATAGDAWYMAVQNTSGSQVGIFHCDSAATANAVLATDDDVTLVALLDVTGTFSTSNMAVY